MNPLRTIRARAIALACLSFLLFSSVAEANEIFVLPTHQADTGGVGIGNGIWPVSALGVTRLVVAVPADLMAFVGAKIALVPSAPGGAGVLHVFVCTAKNSDLVGAACSGPIDRPFTGVTNRLVEVDISTALAARVAEPGARYIAIAAYTTPTFTTDHIVGMRFVYEGITNATLFLARGILACPFGICSSAFRPVGYTDVAENFDRIAMAAPPAGLTVSKLIATLRTPAPAGGILMVQLTEPFTSNVFLSCQIEGPAATCESSGTGEIPGNTLFMIGAFANYSVAGQFLDLSWRGMPH
jgi:hypothetical protein